MSVRRVLARAVVTTALAAGSVCALAASSDVAASGSPARETAAAREQARLCERLNLEEGVAACRAALAQGIGPARRGPVRQMLARHLVVLEKWEDLTALFREDVRLTPKNAEAWRRLGATLLFALDQRAEAIQALSEAARLAPGDAESRVLLGLALAAEGRQAAAAAALREALRIDPGVLEDRPAAQAVLDAAEAGRSWP